jgi:hypothetical protein
MIGYAQSGKDTVAAHLVERYGFRRYAFADALKRIALDLDPIVEAPPSCAPGWGVLRLSEVVDRLGWEGAKKRPEVRRLLQHLGVAVRDRLDPDAWVNEVMRQLHRETAPVVITDVRFPNEAKAIREQGGILVRVERPGVGPVNAHHSETALDDLRPEWTVQNDSDIPDLLDLIDRWYAREITR